MGTATSSLAFNVRQALAAQGITLSTGHAQQLLAAGLGHNNLASLQASGEADRLEEAEDIVLDVQKLRQRASELGCPAGVEQLRHVLQEEYPEARFHQSLVHYHESVQAFVNSSIENDDDMVNSQVAMTNGYTPQAEVQLELEEELASDIVFDLEAELSGLVTVDQDPDRVFWGDEIEVEATLQVIRLGRRIFGKKTLDVTKARLRWMNETDEPGEEGAEGQALE